MSGQNNQKTDTNFNYTAPLSHADAQNDAINFDSFQFEGVDLLASCIEIQNLMQSNRDNRMHAQRKMSKIYRSLPQLEVNQESMCDLKDSLQTIRLHIADLDIEHRSLYQKYISQQGRFRKIVAEQRCKLIATVNKTRSRTAMTSSGLSLVASKQASNAELRNVAARVTLADGAFSKYA